MSIVYPSQIDDTITLPPVFDSATAVNGAVVNTLRSAILAIENELGIKPSSVYGTIKERLDAIEAAIVSEGGGGGSVIFSGDLFGNPLTQTVIGLRGKPVSPTPPTTGQILSWDGSFWAPMTVDTPIYEINFVNGTQITSNGVTTIIAERVVDLSIYPPKIGDKFLKIKRYIYANTTAGTGNIAMFNVTDSVFVNPTNNFTSSTTTEFVDDLTIGANGFGMTKQYQIRLNLAGAGGYDIATCLHARLQIYYA